MTLTPGARVGPYEVLSLVGVGGMGEVYKARDTRLGRIVAIKLLHPDAADRADRRARFESEARAISSLNHPHICALFDVGAHDDRAFLVMEYLEGETLEDRLARGPLSADDVLRSAVELAGALDHAHRQNIVHRDIKPSNVMLTASGVKLLDFGLAKAPILESSVAELSTLTHESQRLTAEGTLVGTFQYMAPEQLEGRAVDGRTDVFALGTVMYEMATGRRAFEGASHASLIASILMHHPPPISSAGEVVNADARFVGVEHVIERCLAKSPDERWQTARDVRLELEWILKDASAITNKRRAAQRLSRREALAWTLAVVAAAAVGGMTLIRRPTAPAQLTRFIVSSPPGTTIGIGENRTRMALSPDGRRLAIIAFAGGTSQLWIQSLDAVTAQPVAGTEGAVSPFWSPDSRLIGFFSPADGAIKKVDASGGPVLTICAAESDGAASWGRDGTILFTQFPGGGIRRVSADGGSPVAVTQVNKDKRERNHYWPEFLPDGRHFLYMATGADDSGSRTTPSLYIASFDGSEPVLLTRMDSRVAFVEPDRLLFVKDGVLLAQRFDLRTLRLTGEPIQIADEVAYSRSLGNAGFSVSANGVLGYQGGGDDFTLTWYDRSGTTTPSGWPMQTFGSVRISPDAQRVAIDIADPRTGGDAVWIYDVARGISDRFTAVVTNERQPVWAPDGRRVLFRGDREGAPNLYVREVGGAAEPVLRDPSPLLPEDWSSDGEWIAYVRQTRQTAWDLWLMPTAGDRTPRAFLATQFDEWGARFSPDSRWLAFASSESGASEVYVAPVGHPEAKQRISVGGGTSPRWGVAGRELFYASTDQRSIMLVTFEPGSALKATLPVPFLSFSTPAAVDRARNVAYDITPDGQRFLVSAADGEPSSSRITIVLNWQAVLTP